jgi:hypothetical protein
MLALLAILHAVNVIWLPLTVLLALVTLNITVISIHALMSALLGLMLKAMPFASTIARRASMVMM